MTFQKDNCVASQRLVSSPPTICTTIVSGYHTYGAYTHPEKVFPELSLVPNSIFSDIIRIFYDFIRIFFTLHGSLPYKMDLRRFKYDDALDERNPSQMETSTDGMLTGCKRKDAKPKATCKPKNKSSCDPKPKKTRAKPKASPKKACSAKKPKKPKKTSCKPGPIMNNGYLNFVRAYREKHCGMKPRELIRRAARAWCRLSEEKKDKYRRMVCFCALYFTLLGY